MNDLPAYIMINWLRRGIIKSDESNPKKLYFWLRELCHFVGGLFLGFLGCIFYGVFAAMWMKETIEHAKTTKKEWSDIVAWSLGALIGNALITWLIIAVGG